ncbi:hypothetical protein HPB50_010682 [Hyalomma asiaticum]|uniref:Uncharacterized protein n=1 Tax=Hyalomma asiaticum TaxID=266040 RepID=A0ACB7SG42_HYAAI|nr:hypothetical protein HPB50_010682 [Hyalomma asiaticum]
MALAFVVVAARRECCCSPNYDFPAVASARMASARIRSGSCGYQTPESARMPAGLKTPGVSACVARRSSDEPSPPTMVALGVRACAHGTPSRPVCRKPGVWVLTERLP